MNRFSAKNRQALLAQVQQETFDVLVIGGGITGAGIALDAVTRGLRVCLIEMQDFAGGTSSRSTRLIHGGLRYLKQLEFGLVAEVAKERDIIFKNAPHLVKPELLLLPITKTGSFGKLMTRFGMSVYERLARVKKGERHKFLTPAQTLSMEPMLKKEGLLGGILYYEYRTDDARLTLSVLKEAVERGALVLSYARATGFLYDNNQVSGIKVQDQLKGNQFRITSRFVVNASGPWVDELDELDNSDQGGKLQLTKGVHLVLDSKKLPIAQGVYFDTNDKRMIFALPHRNKTYIGTTDTFYQGDKQNPSVDRNDCEYLLSCVNGYFKDTDLRLSDVESVWAGIRPLIRKPGKKPSEISRKDETFVWPSGLISIAGGKLTGYRKMAERVLDLVAKKMFTSGRYVPKCSTDAVVLAGGNIGVLAEYLIRKKPVFGSLGISEKLGEQLINRYGSEVEKVFALFEDLKNKNTSVQLPLLLQVELLYAIEYEMCLTPCDFFIRRTGMLYFDIDSVRKYKHQLIVYMQEVFAWSHEDTIRHTQALDAALSGLQTKR